MSLAQVACFPTRVEADLARLTLESHGIDAVLMDTGANSFFGGGGLIGVRLMVLEDDFYEARRIIADY